MVEFEGMGRKVRIRVMSSFGRDERVDFRRLDKMVSLWLHIIELWDLN